MMGRWLVALVVLNSPGLAAQDLPESPPVVYSNAETDAAIRRGLDFLQGAQEPDGAWVSESFGKATSVTSLAVMAYLACGHLPGAPGPYQEAIERGIDYVISHQRPNGLLVSNTSHGISTLMLAEVVGATPDPALADRAREALVRAVDLIVKAQDVNKTPDHAGGWRYQPNSFDSDLSVTGWQVIALRAARAAGCAVPAENIDRAVEYVKHCAVERSGGFSYQAHRGGANNPRTGTGILALELCGEHHADESIAGAEYLMEHPPRWGNEYFFYEVYYCPQALFQVGDEYFGQYFPRVAALLLEHQEPAGSWLAPSGSDRSVGRSYCTAMAVLALAVEYRYLPIYQR